MNSLNILSSRVIGQAAPAPQSSPKSSRSRSISEGFVTPSSHSAQPRRSASQHIKAEPSKELDEKDVLPFQRESNAEEASVDEVTDEKSPLLGDQMIDVKTESKPNRSRLRLVVKRLANAIAESLRWVLSKLVSPGVYIVACFYDSEGHFSPLMPLRKGRRRKSRYSGSNSTAHAVGFSGSSDPAGRVGNAIPEKRMARSSVSNVSERSSSPESASTSDSEIDRREKGGARSHQSRWKQQQPTSSEGATPTRRSIRIKLRSEDSTRRMRTRKTQNSASAGSIGEDVSPGSVTAANLKSPTSPPSSLRLTKYPRAPAPPRPLIPRRQPSYSSIVPHHSSAALPQKTLVIDLDETLIHSLAKGGRMSSGHMVEVKLSHAAYHNGVSLGPQHPILYYVHKRPHCDEFLKKVCKWYNLVVFTASVQEYADPVIDWLEQERKYFSARYYRQHCTFRNGAYIKDLSSVEPDLSSVVILDNSPLSYIFHEDNAIPIEGWINDPTDNDLLHLIPMLEALQYVMDVRALLALRKGEAEASH
ncbi:Nuclear envelope morphology protein 1 [Lambiella insularis]|nr:Nuclear envelope morphology protein 1 [Lambiella insularis]